MIFTRIDIVNKKQFENSDIYKEIKIIIPRDQEKLKKDFEYLDLNYDSLSLQDTHIKECEFICLDDVEFAKELSTAINRVISKANESGFTTPYERMGDFTKLIDKFASEDRDKLLAILEVKREKIANIDDVIKYTQNIRCFELIDAYNEEELGKRLFYDGLIDIEDIIDYADMFRLGEDYAKEKDIHYSKYGYVMQDECFKEENQEEEELE